MRAENISVGRHTFIIAPGYDSAVRTIRTAIEKSRYRAARAGNAELLSLYYGIGKYVSENTRSGAWGSDAIDAISKQLLKELPGLRGFSETNIKYMRLFYENWEQYVNRQPAADDLELDGKMLLAISTGLRLQEKRCSLICSSSIGS